MTGLIEEIGFPKNDLLKKLGEDVSLKERRTVENYA